MAFRPDTPSAGPPWLPRLAESVAQLFRQILPAPLRLFRSATAELPPAAKYLGGALYDTDEANVAVSDGSTWKYWSFSDHVHAAGDITFSPAGNITASDVQAAIEELDDEKAALASPGFTGTPTAPTADPGTNTTQLATTAFVRAEVAALVDTAPSTLDTLNELAAALGDDPNFATTVTNALAAKQPLDGELTAIAGLTSAADKVPYFTGAGSAALADFTSFGRTLVANADAAEARIDLGLGTAAIKDTGTSGNTVPLLDGTNTWSAAQTIGATTTILANNPVLILQDANSAPDGQTAGHISFRSSDNSVRFLIERTSAGTAVTYTNTGNHVFVCGSTTALTLTASAVSPISSTTASAANVHQASSGSALLRSTSSARYKTAINPLAEEEADKVLLLEPISYRSLAVADDPDQTFWGFTAEQADEVLPVLVNYNAEGAPDSIQYERVIIGLISVVKRLEARVTALEPERG